MFLIELDFILSSLNKGLKVIGNTRWSISCRNMQLELIFFLLLLQKILKKQKTCRLDTSAGF